MAHSNSNLTPTVVSDKNGKITTVHKRQDSAAVPVSNVPAPVISESMSPLPSKAVLARRVVDKLEYPTLHMEPVRAKIKKWVDRSTPAQLAVLDEAVGWAFGDCSEYEQSVITGILNPLATTRGDTQAIDELLALREAFCSDWAEKTEPGIYTDMLEGFVYGIRDEKNRSKPLDLSDEGVNRQNIALLRFAYELMERAKTPEYLPTTEYVLDEHTQAAAYVYKSDDLKALICQYADRVDDLISLALDNDTTDAHRLRALLEHEGHSSLVYGML
jgi:hypothetical protein